MAEPGSLEQRQGRAPWLRPDMLDAAQRGVYDAIVGGPRAGSARLVALTDSEGRLEGPFNAMLLSPEVGDAVEALGAAIRYRTQLSDRVRELAILEVARRHQSEFEWYAHARLGAAAGLTEAELHALRIGGEVELSGTEALVRRVVAELITARDLDDELFALAEAEFGAAGISELVTLVGHYQLLALSLRVWRTPLPAGADPVFAGQGTGLSGTRDGV